MNTEPTGVDTPAPVADDTATQPAETSAPATDQPATENAEPQQAEPAPGDNAAAAPRKKPGVHNRIDELTRQKHEAIREAEYWRNRAMDAAKADIDALDYDEQLIAKVRLTDRQEKAEAAQANATTAIVRQFEALEDEARAKWADYDAVARSPSAQITQEMAAIIMDSEIGPDLAYHLGHNPKEAARLANLSGSQLAREFGKLEARLETAKPAPKLAPQPISPITGKSAGAVKSAAEMSVAEYIEARKAGKI